MIEPKRLIRKFNPGVFQRDEEVVDQFVVRQQELRSLLDVLRQNVDAPSCQHALVVAPRGLGKTMLLARVAAELRMNPEYSDHLLPVRFMEESYEVLSIADFWLEILRHLSTECARTPDIPSRLLARELRDVHATLAARWRSDELAGRVRATVLDAVHRLDKKIVLMVENIQMLYEEAGSDFGWQLRQLLQTEPNIVLLGSATTRFEELDDARGPFFELFKILTLDPLTTSESRCLWETLTSLSITDQQMRPLEILTGGNPRLLVIIAVSSRHRSMRQLIEELVALVDEHTEYFRNNLNALPSTERRVFLAAIDLWRPSTSREVADRARMNIRTTSALLGRLARRGAVVVESSGKARRYAVAERLYCIFYKLRRDRGESDVVRHLILFMSTLYSRTDFGNMLEGSLEGGDQLILDGYSQALDDDPDIANATPDVALAVWTDRVAEYGESSEAEDRALASRALINIAIVYHNQRRWFDALERYREVVARYRSDKWPEIREDVALAHYFAARALRKVGALDKLIPLYDELAAHCDPPDTPALRECLVKAFIERGVVQAELQDRDGARRTFDYVVRRFRDAEAPEYRAFVLSALAKRAESEILCGRLATAVATCQEVLDSIGDNATEAERKAAIDALTVKGEAENWLRQPRQAIDTSVELDSIFGTDVGSAGLDARWLAMWIKARALQQLDDRKATANTLRWLYERLDVGNRKMVGAMMGRLCTLLAEDVQVQDLLDVLSADQEKAKVLWPAVVAMEILAEVPVRAPAEVVETARDILRLRDKVRPIVSAFDHYVAHGSIPEIPIQNDPGGDSHESSA